MKKSLTFILFLSATTVGHADETMIIIKQDSGPPLVSMPLVNAYGAKTVRTILGEPYMVINDEDFAAGSYSSGTQTFTTMPPFVGFPVGPAVPPTIPVGPGPRCICPESYVAEIQGRIESAAIDYRSVVRDHAESFNYFLQITPDLDAMKGMK